MLVCVVFVYLCESVYACVYLCVCVNLCMCACVCALVRRLRERNVYE